MNLTPIIRRAERAVLRRETIVRQAVTRIGCAAYRAKMTRRVIVLAVADEFARRYAKWRRFSEALNNAT